LYFDVNGVTFAVPLDELGGIHRLEELSHIIGKPAWYLGLQTNRDSQLDVVDTAKWVMSEKLSGDEYKENYQYIVMLGESLWGLAGTELKGTELLNTDKVRWREMAGKRPWLAGMVKEKMCALIHVEALIAMLNAGLDVKALS
uniref:chemotaxis protein CheW n=5 Tax=Vibrio TaxID=662 RepID=UPI001B30337D